MWENLKKIESKQWARNVMRREGQKEGSLCGWWKVKVVKTLALCGHLRSYLKACLPINICSRWTWFVISVVCVDANTHLLSTFVLF